MGRARILRATALGLLFLSGLSARAVAAAAPEMYDSVAEFIAAAKELKMESSVGGLPSLFAVAEMGEEYHGLMVRATHIDSAEVVWADNEQALILIKAAPPTVATHSVVGVLVLLLRENDRWQAADLRRFAASGSEPQVSAKLDAIVGPGHTLGKEDGLPPFITIRENWGSPGYAYFISASYTIADNKIKRVDPE